MKINKIKKSYNDKEVVRVSYEILNAYGVEEIWGEMPISYDPYIVTEIIDPFCLIFCNYAMENGENIESELPITRECFNNLCTYIKVMSDTSDYFQYITINAPIIEEKPFETLGRRGTGCSGGVDSLYTILNVLYGRKEELDTLVLMNCGNYGGDRSERNLKHFQDGIDWMKSIGNELDINTLWIDSNIHEIYEREGFSGNHSVYMRLMGCIALLGKYFGTYYIAADYTVSFTKFGSVDGGERTLIFDSQMASDKKLKYVGSGYDVNRVQKTQFLIQYSEIVKKYLAVCLYGEKPNCSRCPKCERAMLALYLLGGEGILEEAFDMHVFNKNRKKIFSKMLSQKKMKNALYNEIYDYCRINKVKIPIASYVMLVYYWPRYHFNKIQWMRKIYLKYIKTDRKG